MSSAVVKHMLSAYAGFNPTFIQNCVLWLDGADDRTVTRTGSNVTGWLDKSGLGNNTDLVGSVAPTYVSGTGVSPGVSFSGGVNSGMSGPVSITGTTLTVFSAFTFNVTQPSGSSFNRIASFTSGLNTLDYNATNRCAAIIQNNTSSTLISQRANVLGNTTGTFTRGTVFQACTIYNGTNVITYLNGTGSTASASTGTFGITRYLITNATTAFNAFLGTAGIMHEMIAYTDALTTTQREQVEGYLAWKWRITADLPVGQPYLTKSVFTRYFKPTDISNCTLWLDAADSSTFTLSGTDITQWRDKSGGGFNANAGASPTLTTNGNYQVVRFNGSQSLLTSHTVPSDTHTLIAVHVPQNITSIPGNTRLFSYHGTLSYIVFPYMNISTPRGYITSFDSSNSITATTSNLVEQSVAGSFNIIMAVISSGSQLIYNTGTQTSSNNKTLPSGTSDSLSIGRQQFGSEYYQGDVGEMIVYNRAITTYERQQIEGYLAWKWGRQSSLPVGNPFKNYPTLTVV